MQQLKMKQMNVDEKNEGGFLGMLLSTLAANMLETMLAGKPKIIGGGVVRARKEFFELLKEELEKVRIFNDTPPPPLTNFDI